VTANASARAREWSIQDIARATGTTSRTLRHYGAVGLLEPSRIGANGHRYYDERALVRLQRILLLRELGLGLTAIADLLAGQCDPAGALRGHLELLEAERDRLGRQIESVRTTLHKTERGEPLMATEVFDGFDHTRYRDEVIERWGPEAYGCGDDWWRGLSAVDRAELQRREQDIAAGFARLHGAGAAAYGRGRAGRPHCRVGRMVRGPVPHGAHRQAGTAPPRPRLRRGHRSRLDRAGSSLPRRPSLDPRPGWQGCRPGRDRVARSRAATVELIR
jgi:DNA-binding transcriptional MerR regulator